MGISSDTWWSVYCDECGDPVGENDYGGHDLAQSEQEARKFVTYHDGEIREDGKILCSTCADEAQAKAA
jgi:hypothetical protein